MIFLIITILTIVFLYYMFLPWRNMKDNEAYQKALKMFEDQTNMLMQFYASREMTFDLALDNKVIADTAYKERIKECYKYVMKNISSYIYNETLLYLSKDEIEQNLLIRVEALLFESYQGKIVNDTEVLNEVEVLRDATNRMNQQIQREMSRR